MKNQLQQSVIFVLLLFLSGCSIEQNQTQNNTESIYINDEYKNQFEASVIYRSLDDALSNSNCIVTAKLEQIIESNDYREYLFKLTDTIKGTMNLESFYVQEGYGYHSVQTANFSYSTLDSQYSIGREYVLVLSKTISVYFDKDIYMVSGDIFIELDSDKNITSYTRYHEPEEKGFKTLNEIITYVELNIPLDNDPKVYGMPYTKSEEIEDIVNASEYIVKAKIINIHTEGRTNRNTYKCKVSESIKGLTSNEILVILFKDTVAFGGEYLLLLNKDNEDSLIYTLSSVNSVVDIDLDKNLVEEIIMLALE